MKNIPYKMCIDSKNCQAEKYDIRIFFYQNLAELKYNM